METKGLKMLMIVPLIVFWGCKGQTNKGIEQHLNDAITQASQGNKNDTNSVPHVNVQVNRKYDAEGHLRMYDSSYSYSYVGPAGNAMLSKNDSVFNHFKSFFEKNYPGFLNPQFGNVFYNDSLFKYDFFNQDYFRKRYELNNLRFEDMFRRMDSLKNQFMYENYPDGQQKKNN